MVSSLLVYCALFGSQSDTVSLWQSGKPFSQVAASISVQSGTPIIVDRDLGEIRVSAFCTAVTRDRALAALAVILDAKVVVLGEGLRVEKDAAVWKMRDGLMSEVEARAKRVFTKMRERWIALGVPASWEAAQELSQRESFRRRAGVARTSDLTTEEEEVERGTSHFLDWPLAYLCSRMSDKEFVAFLEGEATFASSVPIPSVTQVEPGGSQKGKTVSWVYWYVPEDGSVISVSHEIGTQNRYRPMSNGAFGSRYHDLTSYDLPYSVHLHSQMKMREGAQLEQLMLLERDSAVRALTKNRSASSFYEAVGRSGRPIVALYEETGSFLTNTDLSVDQGGIIAIKPKLHWLPRAKVKDIDMAFPVELFHDPVRLFDAAAELRLNGDAWIQYYAHEQHGGGEHIGDYPDLGESFARLWTALSPDQKRQMLGEGLAGGGLSTEQFTLFKRAVSRGFFNGYSSVFPLQYLAPSQLADCVIRLETKLAFAQQWKRKADGEEAHRSAAPLKQTRFAVEDQWYVATSVSVAYLYDLKIVSKSTEVFSHHGWIWSELARGNLPTLKAAVVRFRREFGVE